MTREEYLDISTEIALLIANEAPYVEYDNKRIKAVENELCALRTKYDLPECDDDVLYVIKELCDKMKIWARADLTYIRALFRNAKCLSAKEFMGDAFLSHVKIEPRRIGEFFLTTAAYSRGELLQYDAPLTDDAVPVPKIGFFDEEVRFPTIYEGDMPWMSICPSEINSMRREISQAWGNVLVLGLGLGYYPLVIAHRDGVQSVTVIERSPEVIRLFNVGIRPFFDVPNLNIIQADAYAYLDTLQDGKYDFCFADIWEGLEDGMNAYLRIRESAGRLERTQFTYWIERQIRQYMIDLYGK